MAFQIPDHGGVNAPGYTYRPLPPTNTLNSPGTSYDNGYANTIATPSSPALSSLTGNRSYVPNSPDLSSSSGRYPTSNEYDLSPPPTHHSRHNSRYPLMHSTSGGASEDGGRSAAAAAGAGAPGNAGGHDDEVVEIQARKIAPVNEKGERTLHRALDANQVTMITLGTTFGTGFLVGSGTALYQGGPLGILISYLFVGFICYNTLTSLCEMATFLPHKKGFVGFASRYIHPAVGFGLGWTYLAKFLFVPASHINTASIIMEYSGYTADLNNHPVGTKNPVPVAIWRLIFIIIVVGVNFLGIRGFGRLEFWLSSFKILVLIALTIFGIVIDLGGARLKKGGFDRLGFRYWTSPYGPMGHAHLIKQEGGLNTFLGFWATFVRAWFSYMGIEMLGAVVGEAANPRVSVPRAVKQTYRLVITLYCVGIFVVGLVCPSNHPIFSSKDRQLSLQGQVSPFKIAANQLAIRGIVPAINAACILFALSGATSNIYTASRVLYGMALDRQAPALLRKVTAGGKPLLAIGVCMAWCFFSYLGQDEAKTTAAFDYFVDLTTTAGAISWICILWAHIRFRGALRAQRYHMDTLKYLSPMYPYGTWFSLIATVIFTLFKGHESFQKRGVGGFIAAYILIPWFITLTALWKWAKGDPIVPVERIDLIDGRREIDLEEENYHQWKNTREKASLWDKIMARA